MLKCFLFANIYKKSKRRVIAVARLWAQPSDCGKGTTTASFIVEKIIRIINQIEKLFLRIRFKKTFYLSWQNMNSKNIVLSFLLLFLIPAAYGQQNKKAEIDSLIRRANRIGIFNGNVLVTDHDKIVYHTAIGIADASGQTPLTERHRFNIGSITKEFSAAGIMILEQEGKLRLQDKVSKYLHDLPSWADSIQIIHLLQYTSGLPQIKWNTVKSPADVMADLKKLERLNTTPGKSYDYNNNNNFLLRKIIEKISRLTYEQFLVKRIYAPVKMETALVDVTETTPLMAKAFNNDKVQDSMKIFMILGGEIAVTLKDLYKWSEALNSFRLLSSASTRKILIPFAYNCQAGLGGGTMEGDKMVMHVHDGTSANFNALLVSEPMKGRTVILLTNNKQYNLYDFNNAIQAILDGKPYSQPKRSVFLVLADKLEQLNGEQILSLYQQLKQTKSGEYEFQEFTLNSIGYYFMRKNRLDDAITVFEYNTILFPSSGNVFDSLGEAYYKKGDKAKALLNYKRSLELDPTNETAKAIIKELENK
jgi:CubicO group peptidase (beta-lactamase class C family)